MRLLVLPMLVLPLLAPVSPASAQQLSPMTGTTAGPAVAPPAAVLPPASAATAPATPARRPRMTMQNRFEAANTTHDGKLTKAQAEAAHLRRVAQNFDAIDNAKHGYVTMDDIRAYNRAQRQARKAERAAKP